VQIIAIHNSAPTMSIYFFWQLITRNPGSADIIASGGTIALSTNPGVWLKGGALGPGGEPGITRSPLGQVCTSCPEISWKDRTMKFLVRVLITAVALFLATVIVPGIELRAGSTLSKVATLIVVALIFGVVNAVLKPVVKTIGCLFYLLTLGLIAFVVNALLLWLTSWVAGKLSLPFHITGFWPAFWGAIIVGVVGWLLNVLLDDERRRRRQARQHF
jgi:putative membrane protein